MRWEWITVWDGVDLSACNSWTNYCLVILKQWEDQKNVEVERDESIARSVPEIRRNSVYKTLLKVITLLIKIYWNFNIWCKISVQVLRNSEKVSLFREGFEHRTCIMYFWTGPWFMGEWIFQNRTWSCFMGDWIFQHWTWSFFTMYVISNVWNIQILLSCTTNLCITRTSILLRLENR